MAADLMTRIILDDKQFNDKLSKTKKQLKAYEAASASVTSALKGMAGGIGLAIGAGEVFNKMMSSSQVFGDKMTASMNAAKDSVDTFFSALTTWDSSSFYNGLDNIIQKSLEATAALDQLGNTTISFGYFSSKFDEGMADAKLIAKNKQLSSGERKQGFADWEGITKEKISAAKVLAEETGKAIRASVVKSTNLRADDISQSDLEKIIKIDLLPASERDSIKERAKADYEEYTKALSKLRNRSNYTQVKGGKIMTKEQEANDLAKQHKSSILFNKMLNIDSDDELQEHVNKLAAANAALKAANDNEMERLEAWTEFLNSQKAGKGSESAPEGSIKDLDKMIADTRNGITLTVNPESRAALYAELQALIGKKRVIEFQYKHSEDPGKVGERGEAGGNSLASLATLPEDKKIENPIKKKDIQLNTQFADSLSTIGSVMGGLSAVTGEGAAAWMGWGANVLQSIATAIPQIQALTAAESQEAVVSGIKSATKTPVVGWLMAGVAAATVIGAIMSIPKFATGGIVPGTSFSGDRVPILANSGEMILNAAQQKNLFGLLNGGGGSVNGGGKVKFEIEGKKLVGVINNYNKQRSKIL